MTSFLRTILYLGVIMTFSILSFGLLFSFVVLTIELIQQSSSVFSSSLDKVHLLVDCLSVSTPSSLVSKSSSCVFFFLAISSTLSFAFVALPSIPVIDCLHSASLGLPVDFLLWYRSTPVSFLAFYVIAGLSCVYLRRFLLFLTTPSSRRYASTRVRTRPTVIRLSHSTCVGFLLWNVIIMAAAAAQFALGDVTFDLAAAPTITAQGYTKAQRDALADDTLIKVYDYAVKSNLPARMTKQLQVTSYNPSDLLSEGNFFNFVGTWESYTLRMDTHLRTYYMDSAFRIYRNNEMAPSGDALAFHQASLGMFLVASASHNGDADSYTIPAIGANAEQVVLRPVPPASVPNIEVVHESLLTAWHVLTLEDVTHSVELQNLYVADNTHRQNLVWSFHYIFDCLDYDLQQYVLSVIDNMPPEIGRTGPVIFQVIAKRMLHTTENLAQKVINGFISLRLTHFESENVTKCVFTLRNVLKFLRYGEANTFAPRTTTTIIFDVFRGSSVAPFRSYVQHLQDFELGASTSPEAIFDSVLMKYSELLLSERWVPQKKAASAFFMGEPNSYEKAEQERDGNKDSSARKPKARPTHDKSGKAIDYTPPKRGESHVRQNAETGQSESWCGHQKCCRWGSHPTNDHDEWFKKLRESYKRKKKDSESGSPSPEVPAVARGAVTFASALQRGAITFDTDLMDGIDI